jgi:hypothetical protein
MFVDRIKTTHAHEWSEQERTCVHAISDKRRVNELPAKARARARLWLWARRAFDHADKLVKSNIGVQENPTGASDRSDQRCFDDQIYGHRC